jgi:hypothetical protein
MNFVVIASASGFAILSKNGAASNASLRWCSKFRVPGSTFGVRAPNLELSTLKLELGETVQPVGGGLVLTAASFR